MADMTVGQRIADRVANTVGSWPFIYWSVCAFNCMD
jgi:uncharacterized membrane protein